MVEKELILYRDIQIHPLYLSFWHAIGDGDFPETRGEREGLTRMKLRIEKKRLLRKIQEKVRKRWIDRLGIAANEDETAVRLQQLAAGTRRAAVETWFAFCKT